jgi:hypothetical protein
MALEALEQAIGHRFGNPELLRLALTHRSFSARNNERLEFLGDSVLNCIIADELFHRFPEQPEGDLSRVRAVMVRQQKLFELADAIGVGEHLLLGEGELRSGGQRRPSILADALEALIGAVYIRSWARKAKLTASTFASNARSHSSRYALSARGRAGAPPNNALPSSRWRRSPRASIRREPGDDRAAFPEQCLSPRRFVRAWSQSSGGRMSASRPC